MKIGKDDNGLTLNVGDKVMVMFEEKGISELLEGEIIYWNFSYGLQVGYVFYSLSDAVELIKIT